MININTKVRNLTVSPYNMNEIEINFDIVESVIDEVLYKIPYAFLIKELDENGILSLEFFLERYSLENIFDAFDKTELKTRLAKYLIE